jgi:hypothetical protein
MDLPSFPSSTSTWDSGQSSLTKKVSPNIYQEKMSAIFSDMENIICFIDNIALITNGSFENHLNQLDEILQRLKENNLQVNGDKSSFCAIEAKFPGFVFTRQGVKPQVKKVKAIVKIATPKTVKQVCSFIGMINYYKDHIPHHSDLLTPLTALTKKGAQFKWTDDSQHSFNELKQLLAKQTVLAYPDFTIPFEIYMDTSNKQIGSVIQQSG